MTQAKLSKQPTPGVAISRAERPVVCLSRSMEKTFLSLQNARAREAYIHSELTNGLAHQIRIIRQQRGWTQKQLAEKLSTTQTTVSRLEDPSYGRYSVRSLLALGNIFEVALFVRFLPFSKFLPTTWDTAPENFEAVAYEDEVRSVQFFDEALSGNYAKALANDENGANYKTWKLGENAESTYVVVTSSNYCNERASTALECE